MARRFDRSKGVWTEVAPFFGTSGLIGESLLRMVLNGGEHDEDKTED
jgi:hypothetical protein